MPLSRPQQEVASDNHRFKVVIAGRRVGKTTLAIREICRHASVPDVNVWLIGSSYRAIKMLAWKQLKRKLLDLRWVDKINESELSITLKNQSVISLKGSDNPDALRGAKLYYCAIDEIADCDPDLFPEIIRPALADSQGGCLFIGTPKGKNNHAFELYCMQDEFPNTWRSFQYTTAEGGFVPEAELEAARAELDWRTYQQEFEATFTTVEAQIAWAFKREHNLKTPNTLDLSTIHVGCDFNVSPVTASIMVRQGDKLYAIDEIQMYSSNTNELADEIKRRYPASRVWCYPDPSGAARRTSAGGQTDHIILRNAGFIVKAPRAHDPMRDRFNALNSRLCSADGQRHLFISPKCKYTIESLEKYSYKEGTQIPDKGGDPDYSHMFDAISYAVAYMFPVTREREQTHQTRRWTHQIQA